MFINVLKLIIIKKRCILLYTEQKKNRVVRDTLFLKKNIEKKELKGFMFK